MSWRTQARLKAESLQRKGRQSSRPLRTGNSSKSWRIVCKLRREHRSLDQPKKSGLLKISRPGENRSNL
jgi:hypothetical protein